MAQPDKPHTISNLPLPKEELDKQKQAPKGFIDPIKVYMPTIQGLDYRYAQEPTLSHTADMADITALAIPQANPIKVWFEYSSHTRKVHLRKTDWRDKNTEINRPVNENDKQLYTKEWVVFQASLLKHNHK